MGRVKVSLHRLYLPRRGRIKEGDALAVYFAMNISRELGDIHRSGNSASITRDTARGGHHRVGCEKHGISFR